MTWSIHHVNLNALDVAQSVKFYSEIIGLGAAVPLGALRGNPQQSATDAHFFGDGIHGLHIGKPDLMFAMKNRMPINPTLGGHVAFNVPDLDAVKRRLDAAGIVYSDPGHWGALPGFRQIYLCDPSMNVIEVNETAGS